jgi:hypothetical protein
MIKLDPCHGDHYNSRPSPAQQSHPAPIYLPIFVTCLTSKIRDVPGTRAWLSVPRIIFNRMRCDQSFKVRRPSATRSSVSNAPQYLHRQNNNQHKRYHHTQNHHSNIRIIKGTIVSLQSIPPKIGYDFADFPSNGGKYLTHASQVPSNIRNAPRVQNP